MASAAIAFLIALIIICLVAALLLWAVQKFFPDIYEPARYVIGAVALIAILYKVAPLISRI